MYISVFEAMEELKLAEKIDKAIMYSILGDEHYDANCKFALLSNTDTLNQRMTFLLTK
jgi:hypothetical protein